MRVVHAPANIGNQPWVLSRNERKLGIESDLVVHYVPPSLLYPADRALGSLGGKSEEELRARIVAGLRAPLDYDVLHFYFGRTFFSWDDYENGSPFPYLDLKIAKALGRPISSRSRAATCVWRESRRSATRLPPAGRVNVDFSGPA